MDHGGRRAVGATDRDWGARNMTGRLRRVLMRRPGLALREADPAAWHYGPFFDAERAAAQHAAFTAIVHASGATVEWLDEDGGGGDAAAGWSDGLADAMFTHDPSLVGEHGAVIARMGKPLRAGEPALHEAFYQRAGIPVLGRIEGPGTLEGGDTIWLDRSTLAVGRGGRTNAAGIAQLADLLRPHGVAVHAFDLPWGEGRAACLHLMSLASPLASDLMLVFAPMLPFAFRDLLDARGVTCLEAPRDEFEATGGLSLNVLALAPRDVVAVAGAPRTRALMEGAGCVVRTFEAEALCIACEGGPTCLTRPLLRDR